MNQNELIKYKHRLLIKKRFNNITIIGDYYKAVNKLIKENRYLRNHFWVYKLDENILEGTVINQICDKKIFHSFTYSGLVPSILPFNRKYDDFDKATLEKLKNKLSSDDIIPIEEELILMARSLWYRIQYRSAIIEISAALEIAVEKKLIEKMRLCGKTHRFVSSELIKTKNNFRQRCDHYLKKYTGKSFITEQ